MRSKNATIAITAIMVGESFFSAEPEPEPLPEGGDPINAPTLLLCPDTDIGIFLSTHPLHVYVVYGFKQLHSEHAMAQLFSWDGPYLATQAFSHGVSEAISLLQSMY